MLRPCGIVQIDCDAGMLDRQGYMHFLKGL